jgi:phosphoglycolate phosphatase-like HAD superfamily hydrolase
VAGVDLESVLVLWDVDLTLVDAGGVGAEIYALALQAVSGQVLGSMPSMPGRTDKAILLDVLAAHGVPADRLEPYYEAMSEAATTMQDRIRDVGRVLPGAREALEALMAAGAVQTVVTGNLRPIAEVKLAAFGLDRAVDLDIGGYGSDDTDRLRLVQLAHDRAEHWYARRFPLDRVMVLGDTPFDISAAHRAGAQAVGVATGHSTTVELEHAGADLVLGNLSDTSGFLAAMAELVSGQRSDG